MATLTVRGLDDGLKMRLRVQAAENGRSMEAEVRAILRATLPEPEVEAGLGSRIHRRFAAIGGIDLDLPPRTDEPRGVDFDG